MANSNTYVSGISSDGAQITTLSNIQGAGLTLPIPTSEFIDIRSPGKIERIFNSQGNSNVLYTTNKPEDSYLKGPMSTGTTFRSIEQGQLNKLNTPFQASRRDGDRITKFLRSSAGTKFILKQLTLQGFQPHDETKVYNPASPIIAALRLATFGLVDRPTRHIDTSNIVGGLLGASGLGSITRTIGGLFGASPPVPAPPRSSVASEASRGFGISTFTSIIGGGDRSNEVVSPLARQDVKDLLRGQTATNAYNAPRYNKLVGSGGGKFFSNLLGAAGKFIQNNTLVGGVIPPKQPWNAQFRADEKTYDLYLNSGKLFNPDNTGIGGGGILGGLLNSIGFGKKANYSLAVSQRFYTKSDNPPNFNRIIVTSRKSRYNSTTKTTNETGYLVPDNVSNINTVQVTGREDSLKYTDLVNVTDDGDLEVSDQLLNYKNLSENSKNFDDLFTDKTNQRVNNILDNLNKVVKGVGGVNSDKYEINDAKGNIYPLQFGSLPNQNVKIKDGIGFDYLTNIKNTSIPSENLKYERRWSSDEKQYQSMTRMGRSMRPTNDVDYVNSLEVMTSDEFKKQYSETERFGEYGPDIIKFYFYDIVNEKYIPFNATVKSIADTNSAQWEPIEYLGRADKLYYYKGFTREVNFSFDVVAHSIKELMPMWERINYLVGLTRPANYTLGQAGGYMISPMVQLTLGDFYKNHNVVITSCNVTIPEEASWETLPESLSKNWYYGPNKSFEWVENMLLSPSNFPDKKMGNSKGRFAQFPRTAQISMNMNVLEKDRPKTGRAIWGDSPIRSIKVDKFATANGLDVTKMKNEGITDVDIYTDLTNPSFSTRTRYDTDIVQNKL